MKLLSLFVLCLASALSSPALFAQSAPAMTPDTVVARVDGKPVTAGELMLVLQMSPPEAQKNLLKALTGEKLGMRDLAGEPVRAALTAAPGNGQAFGGIKVVADSGWFAARPSGTEDVYKIYAESFRSEQHLRQIQSDAQTAIERIF